MKAYSYYKQQWDLLNAFGTDAATIRSDSNAEGSGALRSAKIARYMAMARGIKALRIFQIILPGEPGGECPSIVL